MVDRASIRSSLLAQGLQLDGDAAETATLDLAEAWQARAERVRAAAERLPAGRAPITVLDDAGLGA